jgi:hypothetical protein
VKNPSPEIHILVASVVSGDPPKILVRSLFALA